MNQVVLCVGNSLMGDDGAGPLLAALCRDMPPSDWTVIDGGAMPEDASWRIRELQPQRLVIVDATDMALPPGTVRRVDAAAIAQMFIMTTHSMPLTVLMDQLQEDVAEIIFLGIQPDIVGFYYPMTDAVKQAVELLHRQLCTGLTVDRIERLVMTDLMF